MGHFLFLRLSRWGLLFLAAGFAFFRVASDLPYVTFLLFQNRDIERARLVANGSLILWGPEVTGGGKLPGALYYWLLAIPLKFGGEWRSTWYLLAALWGIAFAVAFAFLEKVLDWKSAFLAVVIFLPSSAYLAFVNSSMAPAFILPAIVGLLVAYSSIEAPARGRAWFVACVLSGLATQLHYTSLIVPLSGLLLESLANRVGLPKLGSRIFLKGLFAFALCFLPYWTHLLFLSFGIPLGVPAPYEAGEAAAALPALIQLAKDATAELEFAAIAWKFSQLLPFPLLAAALALLLVRPTQAERASLAPEHKSFFFTSLAIAFVSAFPAIFYFFRPNGMRYVAPLSICVLLVTCLLHHLVTLNPARARVYSVLNGIGFLIFGYFAYTASFNHDGLRIPLTLLSILFFFLATLLRSEPLRLTFSSKSLSLLVSAACGLAQTSANNTPWITRDTPLVQVRQLEFLAEQMARETGWNYDEARYRLFNIGGQMQASFEPVYRETFRRLERMGELGFNSQRFDGFFLVFGLKSLTEIRTRGAYDWLASQEMQSDLKRGVLSGGIQLKKGIAGLRALLIPYQVIDKEHYPLHFHNMGHPYETTHRTLPAVPEQNQAGVTPLDKNRILFQWRDCPERHCNTGVLIGYAKKKNTLSIHAEILGSPLEQTNEWTGPNWVQMWEKPYLKVVCDGQLHSRQLADSVGINPAWAQRLEGMVQNYHSMLAPMKREFLFPCRGDPKEIRIGREATTIFRISGPVTISSPEMIYRPSDSSAK